MNVYEAINARRSIRGYQDKPVETEKLDRILDAGFKSPSAGPVYVSVIRNRELLDLLDRKAYEAVMAGDNEFLKSRYSLPGYRATYGAPVLVMISGQDLPNSGATAACMVTTMALAACEEGLSSCYMAGILNAFRMFPELNTRIGVPENFIPLYGMVLGYASEGQIENADHGREKMIRYVD